jgi:hypothetical protein
MALFRGLKQGFVSGVKQDFAVFERAPTLYFHYYSLFFFLIKRTKT